MRYVLFSDLHKHTVTKQTISQKVLKEYSGKRNVSNDIITEAQKRFKTIFGYEWKELPKTVVKRTGNVTRKVTGLIRYSFHNFTQINLCFFNNRYISKIREIYIS